MLKHVFLVKQDCYIVVVDVTHVVASLPLVQQIQWNMIIAIANFVHLLVWTNYSLLNIIKILIVHRNIKIVVINCILLICLFFFYFFYINEENYWFYFYQIIKKNIIQTRSCLLCFLLIKGSILTLKFSDFFFF